MARMSDSGSAGSFAWASVSTTRPSSPTRIVPGWTLPCTMPAACSAATASAMAWVTRVGPFGVQRGLAQHVAQGDADHPFADQIGPVALVDRVVDRHDVRVDQPAGRHGRGQHAGRRSPPGWRITTADRPAQDRRRCRARSGGRPRRCRRALPGGSARRGPRRQRASPKVMTPGSGPMRFAFVAHPSSLSDTPLHVGGICPVGAMGGDALDAYLPRP